MSCGSMTSVLSHDMLKLNFEWLQRKQCAFLLQWPVFPINIFLCYKGGSVPSWGAAERTWTVRQCCVSWRARANAGIISSRPLHLCTWKLIKRNATQGWFFSFLFSCEITIAKWAVIACVMCSASMPSHTTPTGHSSSSILYIIKAQFWFFKKWRENAGR